MCKTKHLFVGHKFLFLCQCKLVDFQKTFFGYCFRRGLIAAEIAEAIEYRDTYEAFLAGFFADLGTLLWNGIPNTKLSSLQTNPNGLKIVWNRFFGESCRIGSFWDFSIDNSRVLQAIEIITLHILQNAAGKLTNCFIWHQPLMILARHSPPTHFTNNQIRSNPL